jgi:hypothetical protein
MKSLHTITNFVTPLLSLALVISASNMAAAQNGANANAQNAQTGATQQQEQDDREGAQSGANPQQSRETASDVQPDTDCIDLGPDATANANGDNAQLSLEATAQAERERDDCLDLIRNANGATEDPQGEDADNAPTSDDAADRLAPGNAD